MRFDALLPALNDTVLQTFGQPVTVRAGGTETLLTGIFNRPLNDFGGGSVFDAQRLEPSLALRDDALRATGAGPGDALIIGDREYRLVAILPADDGGLVECLLREVPA
jgi:hypothetical protein